MSITKVMAQVCNQIIVTICLVVLLTSCSYVQPLVNTTRLMENIGVPEGNQNEIRTPYIDARNLAQQTKAANKSFYPDQQQTAEPLNQLTYPVTKTSTVFNKVKLGRFYALIIGNNHYRYLPSLDTAVHDATAMSDVLKRHYGFKTRLLLNATRADIMHALNAYRKMLRDNDNLLIYYAGHGYLDEVTDEGYWLPVNAQHGDPTYWLSIASVATSIKAIPARHVLVIADSCFSGKLTRSAAVDIKDVDYYKRLALKRSRTSLVSGGLEPVADGGGRNNHSVFAAALLDVLKHNDDYLDGSSLFTQIRRPVILNADQTPEYGDVRKAGHEGGDFVFIPIN